MGRKKNTICAKIQSARASAGLTQQQLAEQLGVSYQSVQKYENGRTTVSAERLVQIARALGVPVAVFYEPGPPKASDEPPRYEGLSSEQQEIAAAWDLIEDEGVKASILDLVRRLATRR